MQTVSRFQSLRVPLNPRAVLSLGYHKNVIDHYENPRNVGSMDKSDKRVGTGLVGAPACGDVMKLQIKVSRFLLADVRLCSRCGKMYYMLVPAGYAQCDLKVHAD